MEKKIFENFALFDYYAQPMRHKVVWSSIQLSFYKDFSFWKEVKNAELLTDDARWTTNEDQLPIVIGDLGDSGDLIKFLFCMFGYLLVKIFHLLQNLDFSLPPVATDNSVWHIDPFFADVMLRCLWKAYFRSRFKICDINSFTLGWNHHVVAYSHKK